MAKFEVGQRVRIKPNIDSHWGGMVAVVSSFYRGAAIVTVDNGSTLMYEVNDLEPTKSAIFQPGDIVRAKRGDHIVQNSVQDFGPEVSRELWLDDFRLTTWEEDGYTLTLVKRPEPEIVLPTKPYAFIHFNSNVYIFDSVLGFWVSIDDSRTFAGNEILKTIANVDDYRVIFEGENE